MKNLANCKPSEFLKQTNRIRKSVAKWLTDTDIMNIRRRMPNLPDDVTEDERKEAIQKQAIQNLNDILDASMDEHPDETLELLALLCFVEPEDVDNYLITDYMDAFTEMLNNKSVWGFFTSLMQLANTTI